MPSSLDAQRHDSLDAGHVNLGNRANAASGRADAGDAMTGRTQKTVYWTSTTIIALAWLSGGLAELARWHGTIDGVVHLGYPVYFVVLLGAWKVLGAIAITVPRFPRLKEWAYAGTFFELTGAVVSQTVTGDSVRHILVPAVFAVIALVSWALRPPGRVLGHLPWTAPEVA